MGVCRQFPKGTCPIYCMNNVTTWSPNTEVASGTCVRASAKPNSPSFITECSFPVCCSYGSWQGVSNATRMLAPAMSKTRKKSVFLAACGTHIVKSFSSKSHSLDNPNSFLLELQHASLNAVHSFVHRELVISGTGTTMWSGCRKFHLQPWSVLYVNTPRVVNSYILTIHLR